MRAVASPSQAPPVQDARCGEVVELGARVVVRGGEMTAIGNGLHAVLAAEIVNPGRADAVNGYGPSSRATAPVST